MTMSRPRRLRRLTVLVAAATALSASPAVAHDRERDPDAEIFATNNTRVITDPADPALQDRLRGFAAEVRRIIREGGARPAGSQLLDGVFFSSDLGTTTFERSRGFDVERVSVRELHDIGERIRVRFAQQSVLTFDHLRRRHPRIDAARLEVPGVTAQALRDGLLADAQAREELFGGSVTQDGELILVAELADLALARDFAARIGGDLAAADLDLGDSEFVG
jgi:hypothetical protein